MKLVVLITAQVEKGLDVALAWEAAGAPGVTVVRAHGLHALREELRRGTIELPRMVVSMAGAMAAILDNMEERSELLISLVEDTMVDVLLDATTPVLGDLTEPHNGIVFVVPVERAIGVRDHRQA